MDTLSAVLMPLCAIQSAIGILLFVAAGCLMAMAGVMCRVLLAVRKSEESILPERAPIVDGEALPDGYGISFEHAEEPFDTFYDTNICAPMPLHVWITRRNWKGEYEKYCEVIGKSVLVWDDNGYEWEYTNGYLKVTKSDIDLEKEYEDQ